MGKFVKLLDGVKSNASGYEYKINELNIAENWNPGGANNENPVAIGGFNFTTEEKLLRWIHRGDTLYDVELPKDAEVIDCPSPNCPHGLFRTNKIILKNPRKITEEMLIEYYEKTDLPDNTFYQCIVLALYRNYKNLAKRIIKDRVNKNNVDECILEFKRILTHKRRGVMKEFSYDKLWDEAKEVYNILLNIKEK